MFTSRSIHFFTFLALVFGWVQWEAKKVPTWESPVTGVGARGSSHVRRKSGKLMTADTLTGGGQEGWRWESMRPVPVRQRESSPSACVRKGVSTLASSCCSDKLLTAPATSTSATKDSWEGGRDSRAGLTYVSCLSLRRDSANNRQSLSGQGKRYSRVGRFRAWCGV